MSYATLVGYTLLGDGTGTTPFYSPPFPRQESKAVFSLEATHIWGSMTLVAKLQHRNFEDTSWSDAGTFSDIDATGVWTKTVSDLKEELRFAFTFTTPTGGVHVILPEPTWVSA